MNIAELPHAQAVIVHDDLDGLSAVVAQRIADLAARAIAERGLFHVALAGGETPRNCYRKLRDLNLDWQHVHLYFGDERCLPSGNVQRNDSMVREALLEHIAIPQENIHSIPAELGASEAANRYAVLMGNVVPLDLVLLGMGEDGHTASLFPGNAAIASAATVVAVFGSPKPPAERVSLGLHTLNSARHKLFLVAGAGKRTALKRILLGDDLPATRFLDGEWHLDRAAIPLS